jgi:hypothetical protein
MRALALIFAFLVMLFGVGLALATDDEPVPVRAQALCKDGKLIAVRVFAPFAGTITVPIPPDACAQKAPTEKRPTRES